MDFLGRYSLMLSRSPFKASSMTVVTFLVEATV